MYLPDKSREYYISRDPQRVGVVGLPAYKEELRNYGHEKIKEKYIPFHGIICFSLDNLVPGEKKVLYRRANYLWLKTARGEIYFMKKSLTDLSKHLPWYFVRVNNALIINLLSPAFEGRINGDFIFFDGKKERIGSRYKQDFEKKLYEIFLK